MPYVIRYRLDDEDWRRLKAELAKRAADLRPVLKQADEYMQLQVDDRFQKEQDPEGRPWKPLSETTLLLAYLGKGRSRSASRRAFKKRGGETAAFTRYKAAKKILQEAGNRGGLRGSITYRAGRDYLEHGTNKIYGAIHQLGGQAGRGKKVKIDARPYLGYSVANLAHIRMLVGDYLSAAGPGGG